MSYEIARESYTEFLIYEYDWAHKGLNSDERVKSFMEASTEDKFRYINDIWPRLKFDSWTITQLLLLHRPRILM